MTNLMIVILDDLTCLPDLIQEWRKIGVPGATILESAGAFRVETWLSRVGLGGLDRLFESKEVRRRTLLVAMKTMNYWLGLWPKPSELWMVLIDLIAASYWCCL